MNSNSRPLQGFTTIDPPLAEGELKGAIQSFWDAHPCGAKFAGQQQENQSFFFRAVEEHRYLQEPHIREMAAFGDASGKQVLEIGCGLGTDGAQFARAGARYVGVDLSPASVMLARKNLELQHLPADLLVSDAECLPFPDAAFDVVYSNGVLHHTPNLPAAVAEIHRILRPGGRAIVMVYHKASINYYLGILFLRRLGVLLLTTEFGLRLAHRLSGDNIEHLREHSQRFRRERWSYLRGQIWLNNNTDGVGNPLSCVFTRDDMQRLFARFSRVRTETRFLHCEWVPLARKILTGKLERAVGRRWGWHLYVVAQK